MKQGAELDDLGKSLLVLLSYDPVNSVLGYRR